MSNGPLDSDLASVDTNMPLLAKAILDLRIAKAEVKKTQDGAGEYLSVDLATTGPAKSQVGGDLQAGVHVFDNLSIFPTGKSDWGMVTRNIGSLVQASGIGSLKEYGNTAEDQCKNAAAWAPKLVGRPVRAQVLEVAAGVNPKNGKSFRAKNEIGLYIKQ